MGRCMDVVCLIEKPISALCALFVTPQEATTGHADRTVDVFLRHNKKSKTQQGLLPNGT